MRSTSQRITDEVIIDIKEVIWRLLEQWKAIIIVSLCFMAVFVASAELDYSIDMKKAEKNTDEKQLTAKEIIDSLPKKNNQP